MFKFSKKTAEGILRDISRLSDEERGKLLAALTEDSEPGEEHEAEPNAAEPGTAESAGAEQASEGEPVPESAPEDAAAETEPAPEDAPVSEPDANYAETIQAQAARIAALESRLEALEKNLSDLTDEDDNRSFGSSPEAEFGETPDSARFSAVMRGYAGKNADNYR